MGFKDLFSFIYLRHASSFPLQSRMKSISKFKVGTRKERNSEVEGLVGTPNSSTSSGSACMKTGFVPSGQVEEDKNKASLEVRPPSLNWWGKNLKQIGTLVE